MEVTTEQRALLEELRAGGASFGEIIEVIFNFQKSSYPENHPLRTATERIGFKSRAEREALIGWQAAESAANIWVDLVHKCANTDDVRTLKVHFYHVMMMLIEDGHQGTISRILTIGPEFDEWK